MVKKSIRELASELNKLAGPIQLETTLAGERKGKKISSNSKEGKSGELSPDPTSMPAGKVCPVCRKADKLVLQSTGNTVCFRCDVDIETRKKV